MENFHLESSEESMINGYKENDFEKSVPRSDRRISGNIQPNNYEVSKALRGQ